jgi:outer membrane receptor protein involved in Fe transport
VIDTAYLRTELDDKDGRGNIFVNDILRTRWNWQFTTELSLRMILRYDWTRANPQLSSLEEKTENFNADLLVTYLVNPWTALYVGYNTNYQNLELEDTPGGPEVVRTDDLFNDAKQLFVKLSYLFRF